MPEQIVLKKGMNVYCVGIKGTGVSGLASLLCRKGCKVSGSDTDEKFPTEEVLHKNRIKYYERFSENHINKDTDIIAYSPAYNTENNPELKKAQTLGLPMYTYPEFLGILSENSFSAGISGINGKTTTTALCASLAESCGLSFSLNCGSAMTQFDGEPAIYNGDSFYIAETCEYKRAFLNYHPDIILITNIELDHTDYFKDLDDIILAFDQYISRLPENGIVIYCADDNITTQLIERVSEAEKQLRFIPYGFKADGDFGISGYEINNQKQIFRINLFDTELEMNVPGRHNVLNAAGAAAVITSMLEKDGKTGKEYTEQITRGVAAFRGTKRRAEIYGEAGGIIFMDDYGHHPTSISGTLSGLKELYPERRIIIDFMPHTYSRTESLLHEFAAAFSDAEMVILNRIYGSAREKKGNVDGKTLFIETKKNHDQVFYCETHEQTEKHLKTVLKKDDLFITMGAGDNWKICERLYNYYKGAAG